MKRTWTLLLAIALLAPLPAALAGHAATITSRPSKTAASSPPVDAASDDAAAALDRMLDAAPPPSSGAEAELVDEARSFADRGLQLGDRESTQGALEQIAEEHGGPDNPFSLAAEAGLDGGEGPLATASRVTPDVGGELGSEAAAPHPALAAQPNPFGGLGVQAPAPDLEGFQLPEEVPEPIREPLRQIFAAYSVMEASVPEDEPSPTDVARMQAARDQALTMVLDAVDDLETTQHEAPSIVDCHAVYTFALNADPSQTASDCGVSVKVDLDRDDNVYTDEAAGAQEDAALLVELGGDDVYAPTPEAGSAVVGAAEAGTSLLVDLAGDDTYNVTRPNRTTAMGSALAGAALLYDAQGDDAYGVDAGDQGQGPSVVQGSSLAGSGALIDDGGHDRYRANTSGVAAATGATFSGLAWLVDGDGSDHYNGSIGTRGAVNGASSNVTIRNLPVERYPDIGPVEESPGLVSDERRNTVLRFDVAGSGLLYDAWGNDIYAADIEEGLANGAAGQGVGVLVDGDLTHGPLDGDSDVYEASIGDRGAANGAGALGLGVLADAGGDDVYDAEASSGALHGAGQMGAGILLDSEGNDTYDSRLDERGAAHGAASFGLGLLADTSGENTHRAEGPTVGASLGAGHGLPLPKEGTTQAATETIALQLGVPSSLGVLLGGTDNDTYVGDGATQGVGQLYGTGVLVDLDGNDTYEAEDAGPAQGAGTFGGSGLLVDRGEETMFRLGPDSYGQGVGIQGAGLLLRAPDAGDSASTTLYDAPQEPEPLTSGGGLGLLLDTTDVEGLQAPDRCRTDPVLTGPSTFVCKPQPSAQVPILDPVTGQAIGPEYYFLADPPVLDAYEHVDWEQGTLPKPSVSPCDPLPAGSQECRQALPQGLRNWLARDSANATTDGALEVGIAGGGPHVEASGNHGWTLLEGSTADDGCRPWCELVPDPD